MTGSLGLQANQSRVRSANIWRGKAWNRERLCHALPVNLNYAFASDQIRLGLTFNVRVQLCRHCQHSWQFKKRVVVRWLPCSHRHQPGGRFTATRATPGRPYDLPVDGERNRDWKSEVVGVKKSPFQIHYLWHAEEEKGNLTESLMRLGFNMEVDGRHLTSCPPECPKLQDCSSLRRRESKNLFVRSGK
jgi:hypothetical protein